MASVAQAIGMDQHREKMIVISQPRGLDRKLRSELIGFSRGYVLPNEALSAFKPYCHNLLLAAPNLWTGQLRTAITLLLATAPWSVSAQTAAQTENLLQVISKLKTCVRTYAPAAQAAGVQKPSDAINFFIKTCIPPVSVLGNADAASAGPGTLSLSDLANVGAMPPGIFRRVIGEEWASLVEETRAR